MSALSEMIAAEHPCYTFRLEVVTCAGCGERLAPAGHGDMGRPERWLSRHVAEVTEAITRRAALDPIRDALARHLKTCDVHSDGDPISCGWKRAVADVEAAVREVS